MRGYLLTSGVLFGLMSVAHLIMAVSYWGRPDTDAFHRIAPAAVFVIAGVLAVWAFRLLRRGTSTR